MTEKKVYAVPELTASTPVTIDPDTCNGCNLCVEVCQVDVFIPNSEHGKPPIVLYPGECWYGGGCVDVCPVPGAIKLNIPLMNSVHWKRKDTGEDLWL